MTRSTIVPWLFLAIAAIFLLCVIVQLFLAGLGVFDAYRNFVTHREFGYSFGWLALVMLVLALVGRLPRRQVPRSMLPSIRAHPERASSTRIRSRTMVVASGVNKSTNRARPWSPKSVRFDGSYRGRSEGKSEGRTPENVSLRSGASMSSP